jgi:hypothetical protein
MGEPSRLNPKQYSKKQANPWGLECVYDTTF